MEDETTIEEKIAVFASNLTEELASQDFDVYECISLVSAAMPAITKYYLEGQ